MPRNGSGVYSKPAGTTAVADTLIESAKYNQTIDDLVADANEARPITAGGTGATSKSGATTALEAVSYGSAQTLTAAQQTQARSNVSAPLKGHIYGLTLSNNVTDPTNDIDIAAGEAASTEANPVLMVLSSAITKRLDAAWAVGSGNGGLDTGSIANTTYHIWLIQRSDTGVVDALFSTSATSPTMPTNYDRKCRIFSITRVGGVIRPFVHRGDTVLWKSSSTSDFSATNPGTSAVLRAVGVPLGLELAALMRVRLDNSGTGVSAAAYLSSPLVDDEAVTGTQLTIGVVNQGSGFARTLAVETVVVTNTSSQIRTRLSSSDASVTLGGVAYGYIDTRGRG